MTKTDAIAILSRETQPIAPGQRVEVERFQPRDAVGVARLFYTVYGDAYPVETYYFPDRIAEANRDGRLFSVVARTPTGDIVGHEALYRSSPAHPGLYEVGQGIVLKDYRNGFAFFKMNRLLLTDVCETEAIDAYFGEAVCHHLATQKSSRHVGAHECALEVDLMPPGTYDLEGNAEGRVSCLVFARNLRDERRPLYVPPPYSALANFLLPELELPRDVREATANLPAGGATVIALSLFAGAGVHRANVSAMGPDFGVQLDQMDAISRVNGVVVSQVFLNAGDPAIGAAVDILRERSYFAGGLVPRWFDADGFLMQRLEAEPGFDKMKLYAPKAEQFRDLIRADWERANRGTSPEAR